MIIDLGSGWGGLLRSIAKEFPDATIIGYECSIIPYFWSRCFCRHSNIIIKRQDFLTIVPPPKSVLLCYLCPKSMKDIARVYRLQDHRLISHTFSLPGHTASETFALGDLYRSRIYVYDLSANIK